MEDQQRILVLGGTAWLGRAIATNALVLGHRVTCLARGESGSVPDDAVFAAADRDWPEAYDEVASNDWDVVIDVARQPGHVRRAVHALGNRSRSFVFVSSGNVHADHCTPGQDETAPLLPALDGDVMETMETYGQAKVACEQHIVAAYGLDRSFIARVGLIGGPGDLSGRTGYWPWRFARPASADGSVLVPDAPGLATQVIDVRDLACWIVESATAGAAGIFNAAGETVPLGQHLEVARNVSGHSGPVVAAASDWLLANDVQSWMGPRSLPLWISDPDWAGFNAHDSSKARAAGLVTRPLEETLRDTLAWELTRDLARPRGPDCPTTRNGPSSGRWQGLSKAVCRPPLPSGMATASTGLHGWFGTAPQGEAVQPSGGRAVDRRVACDRCGPGSPADRRASRSLWRGSSWRPDLRASTTHSPTFGRRCSRRVAGQHQAQVY